MKSISRLRDGLENRVNERVNKLKNRLGYRAFNYDITRPQREKELSKNQVLARAKFLEVNLPEIRKIIGDIRQYVPQIWNQDAITAVYLLIAKSYVNLETIINIAKEGCVFEVVEIARSAHESLDLAFLFLEEGQEERLKKWFKGKIIENKHSREQLHRTINSEKTGNNNYPVYDTKTDIYGIYSLYTHSSYAALLDLVDVFHEDFDYEKISSFHYTLKYFDAIIDNLTVSLLLELKNVFVKYKNLETANEIDNILERFGKYKATSEEIKEIFDKYKNE